MKFEFELPIVTFGLRERRKNNATVAGTVPVEIEVEECDLVDLLPVADVDFSPSPTNPTGFKCLNGDLYVPLSPCDTLPRTVAPYSSDADGYLFGKVARMVRTSLDNARSGRQLSRSDMGYHQNREKHLEPLEDMKLVSYDKRNVSMQIAAFRERCDRLLVCEGIVHLRVAEPAIGVDVVYEEEARRLSIRPVWRSSTGIRKAAGDPLPPHALFRLDDEQGLRDFCLAAGASEERLANWNSGRVRIVDATRLQIDSTRLSVFAAAARIVRQGWGKQWLGDDPVIDGIFEIVDNHTDTDFPDRLGELLSEAVVLHKAGTTVFRNEVEAEATKYVVDMWEARDVELSMGIEGSRSMRP